MMMMMPLLLLLLLLLRRRGIEGCRGQKHLFIILRELKLAQ
jgi:hypothetical protein